MHKGAITTNSNLDPRAQGWIEEQAMDDSRSTVVESHGSWCETIPTQRSWGS